MRSSPTLLASHGALLLEAARPYGFFGSPPSVFAALFPASVATHDTKSEPQQGPEDCGDDGIEPQRPGEVPDQEVKSDLLGVLDDEYQKQSNSDERCNRSTTQSGAVLAGGTRARSDMMTPFLTSTTGQSTQRVYRACHMAESATLIPSVSREGRGHRSHRRGDDQGGGGASGGRHLDQGAVEHAEPDSQAPRGRVAALLPSPWVIR